MSKIWRVPAIVAIVIAGFSFFPAAADAASCDTTSYRNTGYAICQGKAPGQKHRAVIECVVPYRGWPTTYYGNWTKGSTSSATCPSGTSLVSVSYQLSWG